MLYFANNYKLASHNFFLKGGILMAKYDDLGYCPADSFKNYSASPLWPRIQEILKDHFNYMVYKREEVNYEFNFLADCIVSCQSTIGLEIAISISILFSKTSMKNKNHIWISDLVTPLGIPEIQYKNGFF